MEGAEQRMQLHYKVFAAELRWLRAHLGLVLHVHPQASLCAAVACAFGKAVWKAPLLWRYHRYSFTNSTFASLAVWSLSSWFCLFALVSVGSNQVVAVCLTSPVCPVSSPSANTELECFITPSFLSSWSILPNPLQPWNLHRGGKQAVEKGASKYTREPRVLPLPSLWVWPDEWIDLLLQPKMLPSPVIPSKVLDTWRNCERQCYKASTFRTAEVPVLS